MHMDNAYPRANHTWNRPPPLNLGDNSSRNNGDHSFQQNVSIDSRRSTNSQFGNYAYRQRQHGQHSQQQNIPSSIGRTPYQTPNYPSSQWGATGANTSYTTTSSTQSHPWTTTTIDPKATIKKAVRWGYALHTTFSHATSIIQDAVQEVIQDVRRLEGPYHVPQDDPPANQPATTSPVPSSNIATGQPTGVSSIPQSNPASLSVELEHIKNNIITPSTRYTNLWDALTTYGVLDITSLMNLHSNQIDMLHYQNPATNQWEPIPKGTAGMVRALQDAHDYFCSRAQTRGK